MKRWCCPERHDRLEWRITGGAACKKHRGASINEHESKLDGGGQVDGPVKKRDWYELVLNSYDSEIGGPSGDSFPPIWEGGGGAISEENSWTRSLTEKTLEND